MTEAAQLPPPEEASEVEDADHEHTHDEEPEIPKVEASVWRLGPGGLLITSVFENQVAWLAEAEPNTIFFYGDLDSSAILTVTDETMQKVYTALADQGLSEGQIVSAVSKMQHAGIYFKESGV